MGETDSETPKYTDRQLALLRGETEPEDNEEWTYVQDHASDVLPKDPKDRKSLYSITGEDLDKSRHFDRGSTYAGHIGEALDDKD